MSKSILVEKDYNLAQGLLNDVFTCFITNQSHVAVKFNVFSNCILGELERRFGTFVAVAVWHLYYSVNLIS